MHYLLLTCSISLGIVGQICFKYGAIESQKTGFINLPTFMAFSFYFMAAILYTLSLKRIPLSIAYPSISISYVIVAWLAHVIWKEEFGANKIVALLLITCGLISLFWQPR